MSEETLNRPHPAGPPIGDPDCPLCRGNARASECPCVAEVPKPGEVERREQRRGQLAERRACLAIIDEEIRSAKLHVANPGARDRVLEFLGYARKHIAERA